MNLGKNNKKTALKKLNVKGFIRKSEFFNQIYAYLCWSFHILVVFFRVYFILIISKSHQQNHLR